MYFGSSNGRCVSRGRDVFCLLKLRQELEALGYRDSETLFGAPYDIRHAPPSPGQLSQVYSDYFARVKDLVQNASLKNGNKPAILVGHSFGARAALDFVNSTPL
jgi:lysophospholipase-3